MTQSAHNTASNECPRTDSVLGSLHGRSREDAGRSNDRPAEDPVAHLQQENDQLREAIDSRAVIEQAKGALMWRFGLDPEAAFAVLRRWSQDSNAKLRLVADTLVNTVCRDDPRPPADPALADWLRQQVVDLAHPTPRSDAPG